MRDFFQQLKVDVTLALIPCTTKLTSSKWINVSGTLYGIIVALVKTSILLQYLRIFVPNRTGNMRIYVAIQITLWSCILIYSLTTIFLIALYRPRRKIWNPLMTTGHCFDSNALYMAVGVFNIASDFSILILPMVPIYSLQLPLKKKGSIIAIFATGFL